MQRRNLLAAIGSAAAGSAAAMGTGAFTSVSADRSVSVAVEGDKSALLGLDATTGTNSAYAKQTDSGEVTVAIDETDTYADADGVNANALTKIFEAFQITNQGTQPVAVWVPPGSVSPASVGAVDGDYSGTYFDPQITNRPNGSFEGAISGTVVYYLSGGEPDFTSAAERAFSDTGGVANYILGPGEAFDFGLYFDAEENSPGSIDFTINATAEPVPDGFSG